MAQGGTAGVPATIRQLCIFLRSKTLWETRSESALTSWCSFASLRPFQSDERTPQIQGGGHLTHLLSGKPRNGAGGSAGRTRSLAEPPPLPCPASRFAEPDPNPVRSWATLAPAWLVSSPSSEHLRYPKPVSSLQKSWHFHDNAADA